ncbi:LysR family transcriptional regulator [Amycolatopsis nigrescens]|uniref:LysR family transcriptional regulator n=1 Tax=Amycolatopsis nigrescens TaxID=381445 RepID=UPI00035F04DE|nr:LysR family transcriptional regulator [Amycolatopsis nigrescens]
MLSLERLRVLRAVRDTGSVRGAAGSLHVTTSAISQQLARLEREAGQQLLERFGRGVRLTSAGTLLAGHADRLLGQLEEVEADLDRHRGAVAGTLIVAAFATAARGLLPAALSALRARYPELAVRLAEQEPAGAIDGLSTGDYDVAVVQDWPDDPLDIPAGLASRRLCTDELDLAVPAGHPLADRDAVALTELAGVAWISWPADQFCHGWLSRTLRKHGMAADIVHTASEHSTQLALVAAGLGVSVLPRLGREPLPDAVRVVPLRPAPRRRVSALWRTGATRRPAVQAMLRQLANE